jgi:hypothetical protein
MSETLVVVRMPNSFKAQLRAGNARVAWSKTDGAHVLTLGTIHGARQSFVMRQTEGAPARCAVGAVGAVAADGDSDLFEVVGAADRSLAVTRAPPTHESLASTTRASQPEPKQHAEECVVQQRSFVPLKSMSQKRAEREEERNVKEERKRAAHETKSARADDADSLAALEKTILAMFLTSPYILKESVLQETNQRVRNVDKSLAKLCNHVKGGSRKGLHVLKPEYGGTVDPRTGQGR